MPVGLSYCYCTQRIPRAYPKGQAFMSSTSPQYGNDSISQLKGADRVRKRPGVIFGSDGLDGCEHAVFEILSNAIDEAREGYGNLITLTYFKDKSIEVADFGRGCPLDWNPNEKRYNWELVFCELYAGGKYKNDAGGDYEFSLGLNGLGSCATQYASEYMDVTVWRDGNKYSLHFKKGEVVGKKGKELTTEPADRKKTGTTIRWRPDVEVFTDIDIPEEYFDDMLHRQAVVNAGVTFRLRIEKDTGFETRDYCYENGIVDYVKELAGGAAFTEPEFISAERKGRDREDKGDYKVKISAAFCFSNKTSALEYYHNSSWLENGGAPDKAVKLAFTSAIDAYIKQAGKYQKNEAAIKFQDVQDCLILVTNCFSTQTSYENQTKKAINNRFIQTSMTEFFKAQLEVYSALGACKLSRDAEFQGIMPVRGKILNCLKADYVRIFKSDVITDLMKVLGCGVEVKDKHVKDLSSFDLNNLRWNKVIICTDADVDGFQIRTLILTMLYRLVPTLINMGYVYIAESPLYEIESKGKTYFAYSEREKAEIIDSLKGAKASISRSKGLGENDPDMMWMTTMNPETRRLIKVMPEDIERMAQTFDLLLGDNLEGRKNHIAEFGHLYLDLADIS